MIARFSVAALLGVFAVPIFAAPALADEVFTATFSSTGAEQTFVVPADVSSVDVVAVGASGGSDFQGAPGGTGAAVTGTLAVTPGSTLFVEVGGNGSSTGDFPDGAPGGFNGGGASPYGNGGPAGSGGGATDIRTVGSSASGTLASRMLVAGGGGGGGKNAFLFSQCGSPNEPPGGTGGNAGAAGGDAPDHTDCAPNALGGHGGGPGTDIAGGAGGAPGATGNDSGAAGSLGNGGPGSQNRVAGGGGGGGVFGGGGGGSGVQDNSNPEAGSGGGGGGSSLAPTGGSVTVAPSGTQPSLTITYHRADGALRASGSTVHGREGIVLVSAPVPASGVVATFTDADPAGHASQFTALIDWGDGSHGAGTVSAASGGGFKVTGSHVYVEDGRYVLGVTINDVGGSSAFANGLAIVDDPPLPFSLLDLLDPVL